MNVFWVIAQLWHTSGQSKNKSINIFCDQSESIQFHILHVDKVYSTLLVHTHFSSRNLFWYLQSHQQAVFVQKVCVLFRSVKTEFVAFVQLGLLFSFLFIVGLFVLGLFLSYFLLLCKHYTILQNQWYHLLRTTCLMTRRTTSTMRLIHRPQWPHTWWIPCKATVTWTTPACSSSPTTTSGDCPGPRKRGASWTREPGRLLLLRIWP